jgi:hypothetical protein
LIMPLPADLHTVDSTRNTMLQSPDSTNINVCRIDYYMSRGITPTSTSIVRENFSDHFGMTLTFL